MKSIHEAGFIHRDIKLENILMDKGIPKITDFGLALRIDHIDMEAFDIAGTLSYMY